MKVSVVILTMGDRPGVLDEAIASARRQRDIDLEVVLVGNGVEAQGGADVIDSLEQNAGVPGGRNRGAEIATGDLLFFLDDDAVILGEDTCARSVAMFAEDPALAVVSCRIIDPETGRSMRRHVPRPGRTDPAVPGEVTTFLGGASIVRASAFLEAGGFPASFFYAHEETDLSWRLLDAGWSIRYEPGLSVAHPATDPRRHTRSDLLSMKNRVLLARRNLPWPLVPIYPTTWFFISLARARSVGSLRAIAKGLRDGIRAKVERTPIAWSTVWRLTKLGRPPVF